MRSETDMVAAAGTARGGAGGLMLESPLVGVADLLRAQEGASTRFALRERAFLDLVNVRGEPSDAAFVEAVAAVAGLRLPAEPNTVARGERYDALWLGPDEWLLRSVEPAPAGGLHARLSSALAGADAAAVDVGSGYSVLEISGAQAREALARGCPLDLHPRVFKTGQCAQSHFFKTAIVLAPTGDERMDLVVRRSFADYFCRILLDAAAPLLA
ncbi:sarcosine oxidase subunit gamma [Achromobacter sp. 413638]|uniref:sarcosine oxidase subunit gamma n=1 Tax=Achromobacter sp. 413638 TaxID=3342385 RepID=UPI00370B1947